MEGGINASHALRHATTVTSTLSALVKNIKSASPFVATIFGGILTLNLLTSIIW
jgi:hypothetical protein